MYFPIGWPTTLSECESETALSCIGNSDKSLLAILYSTNLSIWYERPSLKLVCHRRNHNSIQTFGHNLNMVWKPDNTIIVVQTTNHYLLFYQVLVNNNQMVFHQKDVNINGLKRESAELFISQQIPQLILTLSNSTLINSGIMCLMAAEEEIVIATKNGKNLNTSSDGINTFRCRLLCSALQTLLTNQREICGVNWDSSFDESFVHKLTINCKQLDIMNEKHVNVTDIAYSSMIGGFALVLSCGRAAFMPLGSHLSQPSTPSTPDWTATTTTTSSTTLPQYNSKLQFVSDIENACCCAINHKYQLIAYGLRNTEGVLCCLDETENAIFITHRLILSSNTFPNANIIAGAFKCMEWSPDSTVLATSWEKGGFALWSVFGALIACSLSWDFGVNDVKKMSPFIVNSMSWGKEGYHLWMVTKENKCHSKDNGNAWHMNGVCKVSLAKSIISCNASNAFNNELVVLICEDRIFVGMAAIGAVGQHQYSLLGANNYSYFNGSVEEDAMPSTNVSSGEIHWEQEPISVGNLQWIIINMPQSYLANNWPIRYVAIDNDCEHIGIAGHSGVALYSLVHRKWKLFGNESQEKDFEVLGGLLWFGEHIILSCYNLIDCRFEIRSYSHKHKLDNQFVDIAKIETEVLLMSLCTNRLLTYHNDGSIHLFTLNHHNKTRLNIVHTNQINICNLVVPPECVTLVLLTNLHIVESSKFADSILMNICGRLLLLERESNTNYAQKSGSKSQIVYKKVSILASGVENIWLSNNISKSDRHRPHLTQSLYIFCGSNGMGIWLPLFPLEEQKISHSFMGKRIMLPISTHIYPLAVLFRDAVVLGAENDTIISSRHLPITLPFSVVSRTSQVYLHHILRELLRRNLGLQAWDIANSCTTLPYFPHSLELLLHEVLEEEAISSHPIPDALLPRVIDFIREFPVFLQTVVHCARKTELALWPHLFTVVGNPKELFQRCLSSGQLETAASYIIVLQNLESTQVSKQYATLLLESARNAGSWQVVKDLLRFLHAIDQSDIVTAHNTSTRTSFSYSNHNNSNCLNASNMQPISFTNNESFKAHEMQSLKPQSVSTESNSSLSSSSVNSHLKDCNEYNDDMFANYYEQQPQLFSNANTSNKLTKINGLSLGAFPGTIMRTYNHSECENNSIDEHQQQIKTILDNNKQSVEQISLKQVEDQNCIIS